MIKNRETKKLSFCCPHHGVLSSFVEYVSVDLDSKKLVDVPVKYCHHCQMYYTPFTNLLAFAKLQYRGCQIAGCKIGGSKEIPREEVRVPYFTDNTAYLKEQERLQKEQLRAVQTEKFKKYVEGLRAINHDSIILTNKSCFIQEHRCPICQDITKKESVKITQHRKYVVSNVRHCSRCDFDFVSSAELYKIDKKASKVVKGRYNTPFISPVDIRCEYQSLDKYLFIPRWTLDLAKYDYHKLPPHGDAFYDMTSEEYAWVIEYHQPIDMDFPVQLRAKSFLGEAGYSTGESEIRRHAILERCVQEHGKWKVINQLKSNMNIRLNQKNGAIRYANALNIWRSDISYVENKL